MVEGYSHRYSVLGQRYVEVETSWHAAFAMHGITIGLPCSFAVPLSLGIAGPAGTPRAVG